MPEEQRLLASSRMALAAYLHDLGKFAERAHLPVSGEALDTHKQLYCPRQENAGRTWHTHVHAAYSALAFDLIERHLPALKGRRALSPAGLFPQRRERCEGDDNALAQDEYARLWDDFLTALEQIPASRAQALASLSDEQRRIAELADQLAGDQAGRGRGLGGPLGQALRETVLAAETWGTPDKAALRELLGRGFEHLGVDRRKNAKARELWQKLGENA